VIKLVKICIRQMRISTSESIQMRMQMPLYMPTNIFIYFASQKATHWLHCA